MLDAKLNYVVSNGEFCVLFLDDLARGRIERIHENAVLNHGLSVRTLIVELKSVENENRELRRLLDEKDKELRKLLAQVVDPLVADRFADLKESLISYIEEF